MMTNCKIFQLEPFSVYIGTCLDDYVQLNVTQTYGVNLTHGNECGWIGTKVELALEEKKITTLVAF